MNISLYALDIDDHAMDMFHLRVNESITRNLVKTFISRGCEASPAVMRRCNANRYPGFVYVTTVHDGIEMVIVLKSLKKGSRVETVRTPGRWG